jgi:hypothetical protein
VGDKLAKDHDRPDRPDSVLVALAAASVNANDALRFEAKVQTADLCAKPWKCKKIRTGKSHVEGTFAQLRISEFSVRFLR